MSSRICSSQGNGFTSVSKIDHAFIPFISNEVSTDNAGDRIKCIRRVRFHTHNEEDINKYNRFLPSGQFEILTASERWGSCVTLWMKGIIMKGYWAFRSIETDWIFHDFRFSWGFFWSHADFLFVLFLLNKWWLRTDGPWLWERFLVAQFCRLD